MMEKQMEGENSVNTGDAQDLAGLPGAAADPDVVCAHEAHERFAQEYAVHENAVAAYRRAYPGTSPQSVNANAYRVAGHPDVRRRVRELQAARRKQLLEETADLEALVANLCTGKPARLVDPETGNPIPLQELPKDVQDALKGVKIRVTTTREGDTVHEYDCQFPDPLQALKLLAQLRGALIERHDLTSAGRSLQPAVDPRDLPKLDEELRKRLLPPPADDHSDLAG